MDDSPVSRSRRVTYTKRDQTIGTTLHDSTSPNLGGARYVLEVFSLVDRVRYLLSSRRDGLTEGIVVDEL